MVNFTMITFVVNNVTLADFNPTSKTKNGRYMFIYNLKTIRFQGIKVTQISITMNMCYGYGYDWLVNKQMFCDVR